jgi:drug/metabolite transporter (DMT)-like permease
LTASPGCRKTPLVTLILSAIVVTENVTPVRVLASLLVVGGVVLWTAS